MSVNVDLVQTSALVGAVLPLATAVVKQDRLSRRANTIIAVLVALTVAGTVVAIRHEVGVQNLAVSFTALYTTAVAFYHGLWKPTGLAPTVQTRTSPPRRPRPPRTGVGRPLRPGPAPRQAVRTDLARC